MSQPDDGTFPSVSKTTGTARMIFLAVVAQLVLGLALLLPDLGPWLNQTVRPSPAAPSGPVSPGDQRRRFTPSQVQQPLGPSSVPLPDQLPERLGFQIRTIENEDILVLLGGIAEGDAERFERFLNKATPSPTRVVLHSPGGLVIEALRIGQSIRARGLETAVLSGMGCYSSCPYIFAGGTTRQLSRRGALGVHQHYYDTPRYMPVFLAVEGIQQGQSETMSHLVDMGVDPSLMIPALRTPPDQIYIILPDEALELGLATMLSE